MKLARSRFLAGVAPAALEALSRTAESRDVRAGETIGGHALVMLVEGEARALDSEHVEGPGALFDGAIVMSSPGRVLTWGSMHALDGAARDALTLALSIRLRHRDLLKSLRSSAVFRNTSPALLGRLLETASLLRYPKGSVICRQGEPGDAFFHCLAGEIAVIREENGARRRTSLLHPGDTFGEMALLLDSVRTASAEALRDCELLVVRKAEFDSFMVDCPAFRRAVNAMVQERTAVNVRSPRRFETFWIVNRSECPTEHVAALLAQQLEVAYAERSLVLACDDPVAAATQLERAEVDYAVLFASPDRERDVAKVLGSRINTILFLTPDIALPFPHAGISGRSVQYVEIRDPSWRPRSGSMVRPRTVRLRFTRPARDLPDKLAALDPAGRAAIARLARAGTQRMVGLALSGGAAFGYAHLALIRGLVAADVPIDVIASASFGSIIAAMFASHGLTGLDALERDAVEITARAAAALVSSATIERYIAKRVPEECVDALDVPFCPVAVDIDNNRERVFRRGSLAKAVRASCSLPGVFGPTIYEGTRYVDGAVMNNVPASVAAEEGADFLIASNIIPARPKRDQGHRSPLTSAISALSPFGRISDSMRSLFLLFSATGDQQASLGADVTFSPDLAPHLPFDFMAARAIVARAESQVGPVIQEVKARYRAMCRVSIPAPESSAAPLTAPGVATVP